ncbi:bifunctional DNA primase/polymerase [Streptomyces sp. ICBB 8177]|uniref:bifunctional DNA primase/polymerase n=1 Tax=Streptomyces sp. ICBB 8177 TaxID=563922 RepID=UPI000D67945F|nr:bifunctional DNA primase/polymerase [Streptomyces sp. ICBB 8177]PWI43287.1 DNA primase [Streptomyces sp. ICBB 8177]
MTDHAVSGEATLGHTTLASREPLRVALALAAAGVPVLPLRKNKRPFANCPTCSASACGDRPHMKNPGPCYCPAPCHGWAAATTDRAVIASPAWAAAWRAAGGVGYHPGGCGLTVVDLDNPAAVAWAHATLPATRTVATTRGQHWIYRGAMQSANGVRPGVDIKSRMAYARWLAPGTGTMTPLPGTVRALVAREEATPARGGVASSLPASGTWNRQVAHGCRHTEAYVNTGLRRGLNMVAACTESGAGSRAFGVARFLAAQHAHCPGPCDLEGIGRQIVAAAIAVGVPEPYARRAVTNGFHTGQGHAA